MTKSILFDVDKTLFDTYQDDKVLKTRLLNQFGYKLPFEESVWEEAQQRPRREAIMHLTNETDSGRIFQMLKFYGGLSEEYNFGLSSLNEGVEEALVNLRKAGWSMGIVTSSSSIRKVNLLIGNSNIKDYFRNGTEHVVITRLDYAKPKPDPEPILKGLAKISASPKECIYVGDSKHDMMAATAAGVIGVQYLNNGLNKLSANAKATINSFSELPALAERLNIMRISLGSQITVPKSKMRAPA